MIYRAACGCSIDVSPNPETGKLCHQMVTKCKEHKRASSCRMKIVRLAYREYAERNGESDDE